MNISMSEKAGDGFRQFQNALQELAQWMDLYPNLSDQNRAEGHAYIAGMTRWAIGRAFMCPDLDRPRFIRSMDPFSRWGLDNPDNIYSCAEIRGDTEYLIRGERGNCADIAIEVLAGMAGDDGNIGSNIDCIDVGALQVDAEGNFEIRIGGERNVGNHLATRADASAVFVRQTSNDWSRERPGRLTIEKLGPPDPLSPPPDLQAVSRQWALAAKRLREQTLFFDRLGASWFKSLPANVFNAPSSKGSGFLPGQYNTFAHYLLDDDLALVLSVKPVKCRYWSVQAGHIDWVCSFDYRRHQNSLNSTQARMSNDGRYHFVISTKDPAVPNWIDTAHHREGVIFLRWQGVAGAPPEQPEVALIPLSEVRDSLPADEPFIDPESRLDALRARGLLVDKHFA